MKRAILFLLLLPLLLMGCHWSTTVSREDQLAHIAETRAETTIEPAPVTTAAPAVTEENITSPSESTSASEVPPASDVPSTTLPAETAPPATQPEETKPRDTEPKETPPPATTVPETTAASTAPTEDPVPLTEPPVEEDDPYDISGHTVGPLEYAILDAINAERTAQGLPELALDSRLCAITSVRAYESSMSFSHTRPDGTSCFTVLDEYGYSGYSAAGENLLQCSVGYSAEDMVALWMSSTGHRANILSPDFTTAGIGVYEKDGLTYVANLFVG